MTVLFCRHGTFAVRGRRERADADSPVFRSLRYPASGGLGISFKEVSCVGTITV